MQAQHPALGAAGAVILPQTQGSQHSDYTFLGLFAAAQSTVPVPCLPGTLPQEEIWAKHFLAGPELEKTTCGSWSPL